MTKLITIPKFARATGLPYRLCLQLVGTRQIPSVPVGSRRRINVRWVEQWLSAGGYHNDTWISTGKTMSASLTDQAIRFLVDRRWPMLPSNGSQKKPCVGWKQFQEQLPTVEQLRGWEREFRPARWGLVTGELAGIVVVDFDGDKGRELMQKWSIDPHLLSGSGGFHCYVQHPGWRVPTLNAKSGKVSWPWLGLDIRGDGGFAVLLGRNSNGPYVQLRDLVPEPFDVLPEEVRTLLRDRGGQEDAPPKPPESTHRPEAGRRGDSQSIIRRALTTTGSTRFQAR